MFLQETQMIFLRDTESRRGEVPGRFGPAPFTQPRGRRPGGADTGKAPPECGGVWVWGCVGAVVWVRLCGPDPPADRTPWSACCVGAVVWVRLCGCGKGRNP